MAARSTGHTSGSSTGPFHVGLTSELVVDAAVALTRESHLLGWSIRDLAKRLDVAPSVIYHHVGGKDALARCVAERVLTGMVMPAADLPWQDWFRGLLIPNYSRIASHPGVANWVLMHGPTFADLLPVMDAGVATLTRAGFGAQSGIAYAALLNTAMATIAVGDDRLRLEEDGPRDHAAMMAAFRGAGADLPQPALLDDAFIASFAQGGDAAAEQREWYYRFIVDVVIAGLEAQLR